MQIRGGYSNQTAVKADALQLSARKVGIRLGIGTEWGGAGGQGGGRERTELGRNFKKFNMLKNPKQGQKIWTKQEQEQNRASLITPDTIFLILLST